MKIQTTTLFIISIILMIYPAYAATNVNYGFVSINTNPDDGSYEPNYDMLTHICYLNWQVTSSGGIVDYNNDALTHAAYIFSRAKSAGVQPTIGIGANAVTSDSVLCDAAHQDVFVASVCAKINETGAEGVAIDFEYPTDTNSINGQNNKVLYEQMLSKLYTSVKLINPKYSVTICGPACFGNNFKVLNNPTLSNYMDYILVMGYDYNWAGIAAANSPFYVDSSRSGIVRSIAEYKSTFSADKIVYLVPFYGYEYVTYGNQPDAATQSVYGTFTLAAVDSKLQQYGRQWDNNSQSPYFTYITDDSGTETDIVTVLDNCDVVLNTSYDCRINRIEDNGAYKCTVTEDGVAYTSLRNNNYWNIANDLFICADVKAPAGKSMIVRVLSAVDSNYIDYEFISTGDWQHIVIPFTTLTQYGSFDSSTVFDIRIGMFNGVNGDSFYIDNITADTVLPIYHQCWYDDAESLSLKYQYMKDQGIAGVGFWALGYEGNNSDVWNVFDQPFHPNATLNTINTITNELNTLEASKTGKISTQVAEINAQQHELYLELNTVLNGVI